MLRSLFAFLLTGMTGINLWQWVTYTPDPQRPKLKLIFLVEALITAAAGLYLFVSTVL